MKEEKSVYRKELEIDQRIGECLEIDRRYFYERIGKMLQEVRP